MAPSLAKLRANNQNKNARSKNPQTSAVSFGRSTGSRSTGSCSLRSASYKKAQVRKMTELSVYLRWMLLLPSYTSPAFAVAYAATGKSIMSVVSQALLPICFALLTLYGFSAPREKNHPVPASAGFWERPRELRLLLSGLVWFLCVNGGTWYGNVYSDPNGNAATGWFVLSDMLWLIMPMGIAGVYFRRKIASLSDEVLHSYIFSSIFRIGLTSLVPILYLTFDTIKCVDAARKKSDASVIDYASECSGVLLPQASICLFLINLLVIK